MENENLNHDSMAEENAPEKPTATPLPAEVQPGAGAFIHNHSSAIILLLVIAGLTLFSLFAAVFLPSLIQSRVDPRIEKYSRKDGNPEVPDAKMLSRLMKDINLLDKKLARLTPATNYLVINSAKNEFRVYRGHSLLRKGRCSTGSFILLKGGDEQEWLFKTPKGEFRIKGKTRFPVWKKPDWAFIEEGLPVPPVNHSSRYEYGVLGEYALSLGDGYLIHGTLYQRFLGLPVTHGCVRLNDDDLEFVYNKLSAGSKVFIY